MDDDEQAQAYSDADFTESHQRFVALFVQRFPGWQSKAFRAIDLGCGPADVTVRFARPTRRLGSTVSMPRPPCSCSAVFAVHDAGLNDARAARTAPPP